MHTTVFVWIGMNFTVLKSSRKKELESIMTEKFYSKNTDRMSFSVLRFSMILLKKLLKVLD